MGKDQSWAKAAGSQQVPRKYTPLIRRRQTKENETRLLCLLCCCVAARLLRLLRCCVALRLLRCCVAARLLRCCAFAVLLRLLCCCALAVLRDVSGLRRARVRCKTLRLPGSAVARAPPAAGRKQETVRLHGSAASRGPNALRHSESARGCARAPRPGEFYVRPGNRCRKRVDAAELACWQRRTRCRSSCHVLRRRKRPRCTRAPSRRVAGARSTDAKSFARRPLRRDVVVLRPARAAQGRKVKKRRVARRDVTRVERPLRILVGKARPKLFWASQTPTLSWQGPAYLQPWQTPTLSW